MLKRIKEYFKNTNKNQIYQDAYALTFIIGGFASLAYIVVSIARWRMK